MSRQSHYLCEIVGGTAQAGSNNVSEVKISSLMAALSICAVPENGRGTPIHQRGRKAAEA